MGFLYLEMFAWRTPLGLRVFHMTSQQAELSAVLAANQGLYNGFLAAGLVWGLLAAPDKASGILTFFFACVTVAGLYGGATVGWRVVLIQAAPAMLGLALLHISTGF